MTARVKGTAIRGLFRFAKDRVEGGIPETLSRLDDDDRVRFESRILASSWYPYELYGALLEALCPDGDESFLIDLGRDLASQDAGATFKIVALFASVETMLQRSSLFWERHCDTGEFETVDVELGKGTGVLRDFPEVHPYHCRLLTGWIEGMGMAAGASEAEVTKTRCVHRGDPECRYEGRWS